MSRLHGALFAVARAADTLDDPPGWRERPPTSLPTPEQAARVRVRS